MGGETFILHLASFPGPTHTPSLLHRRLLLGTVLLCAAAEAGDYPEVERLLSTTFVSPNACGLRHKNALDLASARGHCKVAEFLIMNGVRVVEGEGVRGWRVRGWRVRG